MCAFATAHLFHCRESHTCTLTLRCAIGVAFFFVFFFLLFLFLVPRPHRHPGRGDSVQSDPRSCSCAPHGLVCNHISPTILLFCNGKKQHLLVWLFAFTEDLSPFPPPSPTFASFLYSCGIGLFRARIGPLHISSPIAYVQFCFCALVEPVYYVTTMLVSPRAARSVYFFFCVTPFHWLHAFLMARHVNPVPPARDADILPLANTIAFGALHPWLQRFYGIVSLYPTSRGPSAAGLCAAFSSVLLAIDACCSPVGEYV